PVDLFVRGKAVDEHNWLALPFVKESDLHAVMRELRHAGTIRSRRPEAKVPGGCRQTLVMSAPDRARLAGKMEWDFMQRLATLEALLVFSAGAAQAQVSDDVVKIGVLTDLSGPAATATGPGSVAAAQMAVEDFGGKVLDKPIAVISADHQIKPDIAAGIARQWYDVDKVDLIVDVPVSAVGLAGQQVAHCRKQRVIAPSRRPAAFRRPFRLARSPPWAFDAHALAVRRSGEVVEC